MSAVEHVDADENVEMVDEEAAVGEAIVAARDAAMVPADTQHTDAIASEPTAQSSVAHLLATQPGVDARGSGQPLALVELPPTGADHMPPTPPGVDASGAGQPSALVKYDPHYYDVVEAMPFEQAFEAFDTFVRREWDGMATYARSALHPELPREFTLCLFRASEY